MLNSENIEVCNDQFWGFIVGGIYFIVFATIAVVWLRPKVSPQYESVN